MKRVLLVFLLLFFISKISPAQDCILKDTLLRVDFGTAAIPQGFNLNKLSEYRKITGNCPDDGMYAFVTSTANCYSDHWHTLSEDHTPGDFMGNMLIVNASYRQSLFFYANLAGLKPGKRYELSTWLLNLCKQNNDCTATLPDITIVLETIDGKQIAKFNTGSIDQTSSGVWRRFFSTFSTPADMGIASLKFYTNAPGGCGNDFAMDDITFRECYLPEPVVVTPPPKKTTPSPVVVRPAVKKIPEEKSLTKKTSVPVKVVPKDIPAQPAQIKAAAIRAEIPAAIRTRENPVIKTIESVPGTLLIELYDNGTIDGDTVSIYLNNVLVVSRAGLSEKPISVKVNINKDLPHQELIMVAENLGSIPPNTSLMVVTSKGRREEVFISSTRQKNAKLVIELKE
ncbi:hypothetical protein [Ferruginibacter sp. HRS2-29]|uniref:hypothetical protein n=1 Tax=Ferruginibacter sp. HRS2-29 TaxID=2487334 RepID=UPI0020CE734D|nr:hypothetical protein [Ferruginibacter sp. HRS2-29]MCP9753104.1 hypothetical protein [Ferruginibacter sp. HRS2-29]